MVLYKNHSITRCQHSSNKNRTVIFRNAFVLKPYAVYFIDDPLSKHSQAAEIRVKATVNAVHKAAYGNSEYLRKLKTIRGQLYTYAKHQKTQKQSLHPIGKFQKLNPLKLYTEKSYCIAK